MAHWISSHNQGSENDLIPLIDTIDPQKAPRFYISCGTERPLFPAVNMQLQKMQERDLAVTFEVLVPEITIGNFGISGSNGY